MAHDDDAVARLRERFAARRAAAVAKLEGMGKRRGELLLEMKWMPPEGVAAAYRAMRRRSRVVLVEVCLLLGLVLLANGLLGRVLKLVANLR